ncbi:tetratricopeptide repeat-containing sensor histidine kinase [Paenimyroides aestuarii]|uniref:Histidine kinase n=1 Tax=Paenimyroides aestuarii TaxID=2968490 RepID=A0ABY5NUV4_9FLAO|nr:histidine kinase [Paenimyroides aestuarii]UUV22371.1 histidine kinase [Paenimyroides aestuarii]
MSTGLLFGQDTTFSKADSLLQTGNLLAYKNQLVKIQKQHQNTENTEIRLKTYVKLVEFYSNFQENSDSLMHYYYQGIAKAKEANSKEFIANFKFQYANYLTTKGTYVEALKLFQSIEDEIIQKDYSFLPHFYDAYARLHYYLKDYDNAFAYLKKEAQIFEKRKMTKNIASVYNNLGILYNSQSKLDSALYYHEKSQRINIQLKDTIGIVKSYNNIGQSYFNHRLIEKAKLHYEKALEYPDKYITESLLNNYAELLINNDEHAKAASFLVHLTQSEHKKIAQSALSQLVTLYKAQHQFEKALMYQEQLNQLSQELLDETKLKEIERLKIEYNTAQKEKEIESLKLISESQQQVIDRNRLLVFISVLLFLISIVVFILWKVNQDKRAKIYELEMNSKVLRLQMNPHFIFNALAAIQSNILSREHQKASNYLVKFSKLLRHHIEQTRSSSVLLQDEIQSLRDYLELQKMRMSSQLSFHFEIDQSLNIKECYIPAMLIQPLVENAIEHGLESVQSPEINIRFIKFSTYIECQVIDNGVGFSTTIHQEKWKVKSYATQIIKERLALLSNNPKKPLTLIIKDQMINNQPKGTIAIIQIPILTQS